MGRKLSDKEAIAVLEKIAGELGKKANELDWSIFESRTGTSEPIWPLDACPPEALDGPRRTVITIGA